MYFTIKLQELLQTKRIIHSETATDYNEGVRFFVENQENADIITYNYVKHFSLLAVDLLGIDNDGHYYYEYVVERIGDIVDNIYFESYGNQNIQLTYYVGGEKHTAEELDGFVFISAPYSEFRVRVTFMERPNPNDEFKLFFRYYLINSSDRRTIQRNKVMTKTQLYMDGMCKKLNRKPVKQYKERTSV